MKFGIFYSHQTPRPWTEDSDRRVLRDALIHAQIADRIGIDHLWAQEHHFLEEYAHSSAPEVFLGAACAVTKRIRIGHGIMLMLPGYNHPARCAERIATLDLLSDGRVEWGTGESGTRIELEAFDVPYRDKRQMWEEAVRETARMLCTTPYPGYEGRFFSMPCRNVVPKPLQRPHPPLWVACSNRESLRHAAQHGIGALTFAFMDPAEAKFWVEEYYDVFARECTPLGRGVNPNVAMLTQFMCLGDGGRARREGMPGSKFFAYGLSHYYRVGSHVPGHTQVWEAFEQAGDFDHAGNAGIGTPMEVTEAFLRYEEAGVDQLILLHQAGRNRGEVVSESLELFGADVLPGFRDREVERGSRKAERLAPAVARALDRLAPLDAAREPPLVESYPVLAKQHGADWGALAQNRAPLPATLWKLQMAKFAKQKQDEA